MKLKVIVLQSILLLICPAWLSSQSPLIHAGAYFLHQYPFDTYAKHFSMFTGAGLTAELDPNTGKLPGFSLRAQISLASPKESTLTQSWNTTLVCGTFALFPLTPQVSIKGELEAGLWSHWLKSKEQSYMPHAWLVYFNPVIQAAVSLRYSRGIWKFDVGPVYTLIPESNALLQSAGVRASIYRSF